MNRNEEYRNKKGQLHRIGGPAYINGEVRIWIMNILWHRVDGPAYIYGEYEEWYINHKEVKREEYIHEEIKDCIYGI